MLFIIVMKIMTSKTLFSVWKLCFYLGVTISQLIFSYKNVKKKHYILATLWHISPMFEQGAPQSYSPLVPSDHIVAWRQDHTKELAV